MHKLRYSVSVAALGLAGGLLVAPEAEAVDFAPTFAPPPQISWAGWYVGGHIGGGEAEFDGLFNGPASSDSAVFFDQIEADGFLGGFHFGYNWDHGRHVFGIEGDFSFMDWNDDVFASGSSDNGSASLDMLSSIRGRLGIAIGEERKGLAFLTGGIAWSDAEATIYDGVRGGTGTLSQTLDLGDVGGVIGVGFEWAHTNHFRLRADTLYYMFDERAPLTLSAANSGEFVGFDDAWVIRVGGSWYLHQ